MTGPRLAAFPLLVLGAGGLIGSALSAQEGNRGVLGDWRESGGSVIRVAPCGGAVCAYLVKLAPTEHYTADGQNPDPAKRTRPLCNLEIGSGFHLDDPNHAEGGELYDPKVGKTYHGVMTADGDQLKLRGYIGIKAFGRSETWTRISGGLKGDLKDRCS